jgi:plastocyanin
MQVHEVRMELTGGKYQFNPSALTIKSGDVVRWINVSGGPHNVAFKRDRVPLKAADLLNNVMRARLGDLMGPYLLDTLAVYEIAFTGAPPGAYAYTCTPHELLGMNGLLTVAR